MPYALITLLLLLLTGCAQTDPQFGLGEPELKRVATILEREPGPITIAPRHGSEFTIPPMSDARIGFTQALSLGECGLVPLIAERNSALGRQKAESTRFIYEWRIREGLLACQDQFADEIWFQEALADKQQDVETAIQAVLFQSIEADAVGRPLSSPFADLKRSNAAYRDAWSRIAPLFIQALDGGPSPTTDQYQAFEAALKQWGDTRHHATLGLAVRRTEGWLRAANALLTQATADNRICPMGSPTEKGRRIATFVQGYFASTIQRDVATLMQSIEHFDALWQPLRAASPSIAQTATTDELLLLSPGHIRTLQEGWQDHVKGWQTILQQCQLAPRADTTN